MNFSQIKALLEISMVKAVNIDTLCIFSFPQYWLLYCRMVGYIENVQRTYYRFCKCKFATKERKKLCDVCNFNRDLWIFCNSELKLKIRKIPMLYKQLNCFFCILNYWNSIKPNFFNHFDYSKERNHMCYVNIVYCI